MSSISLYIDKADLKQIIDILNEDNEIAFLVSDGVGERSKWKAVNNIDKYDIERYCIWHIPSGPLPLLIDGKEITAPFSGWEEEVSGVDTSTPYFGAGHHGIIWLNNRTDNQSKIGLSSFEWIGSYYEPAPEATQRWWTNLRKKIKLISQKIQRGNIEGSKSEVFTLESALGKIQNGMKCDINPY